MQSEVDQRLSIKNRERVRIKEMEVVRENKREGQGKEGRRKGGKKGGRREGKRIFTSKSSLHYDGLLELFRYQDSAHRGIVQRIYLQRF